MAVCAVRTRMGNCTLVRQAPGAPQQLLSETEVTFYRRIRGRNTQGKGSPLGGTRRIEFFLPGVFLTHIDLRLTMRLGVCLVETPKTARPSYTKGKPWRRGEDNEKRAIANGTLCRSVGTLCRSVRPRLLGSLHTQRKRPKPRPSRHRQGKHLAEIARPVSTKRRETEHAKYRPRELGGDSI